MSETILAIDIGSTKICAIIAEVENSKVKLIGHGISKSQGVKKGIITNIELSSKAIKKQLTMQSVLLVQTLPTQLYLSLMLMQNL